jgi:uncharacterized membrane protein YqjE
MHAKEELAEKIGETYGYLSEIIDQKVEAVKLSVAEKSALTLSNLLLAVIMLLLGLVVLNFGLISLAFYLAGDMQATAGGFGIVALIMLALLLIVFFLRRNIIVDPTVSKVISLFFSDDSSNKDNE